MSEENDEIFEDFQEENLVTEETLENEKQINDLIYSLYEDDTLEVVKDLPIKETIEILNKISSILEYEERKFREEIPIGDIDDSKT
jgi:uncharacterized FlaG/YvyC family protein